MGLDWDELSDISIMRSAIIKGSLLRSFIFIIITFPTLGGVKLKAFLIVGSSVLEEDIKALLEEVGVDGYTQWSLVKGMGGRGLHLGTPIWPSLNEVFLVVVNEELSEAFLNGLREMRDKKEVREEGLEVFFWEVERLR